MNGDDAKFLSLSAVSRRLNVHSDTARKLVRQGVLHPVKIAGMHNARFDAAEVDRLIEVGRRPAAEGGLTE